MSKYDIEVIFNDIVLLQLIWLDKSNQVMNFIRRYEAISAWIIEYGKTHAVVPRGHDFVSVAECTYYIRFADEHLARLRREGK